MDKKTEASRAAYNKIAAGYEGSREGRYTRFHIRELADTILLREGDVVLDVACGNGALLRELAGRADIQGNGVDIADNMVQEAKRRCPHMKFEAMPCCPLAWGEESVDVITVCCAFHHFADPWGFVRECKRVLRKGGAAYVADPNFGAAVRFLANRLWFPFSKSGDVKVYSQKELKAFFEQAGFRKVEAYRKGRGVFLKAEK